MTEELENQDSLQPESEQDTNLEQQKDESNEDFEARLKKVEEIAKNQKIRAEKAEAELKALKKQPPEKETETPKNTEGLSAKDIIAIRDLHEEDVDFLLEEAKLRKKSVTELKKDPYMQIILKTREDERITATMANTGVNNKGTNTPSDEEVVRSAFKENRVPDDPAELARAEMALRKKKVQL